MTNNDTSQHGRKKLLSAITRRDVLKASGAATGTAMLGVGSAQAHMDKSDSDNDDSDRVDIEETDVTVSEGTNIMPTVSPDGESIVMGLQGILFRLPRDGGDAEQLTDVELEADRPDYSPDGDRVTFQAYGAGHYDIWTMAPDGSDCQQLTDDFWFDREPEWSPDGGRIAFSSDRGETGIDIWTMDVDTGDLQQWTETAGLNHAPTWSPDGTEIAYITQPSGDAPVMIKAIDRDGNTRTLITAEEEESLYAPSWSPNREDVAYVREGSEADGQGPIALMVSGEPVTEGEDVFVFTPNWLSASEILYSADGAIRELELESGVTSEVPFSATFHLPGIDYKRKSYFDDDGEAREVKGIETPTLSPDGERVAFVALSDLWVMRIGETPYRITDNSFVEVDPAWSPNGRYLAYSSDKNGTQDLYVHDMQTGTDQRLTSQDEDAAISAAWSPDGSKIAFHNQDRATFTIEVDVSGDEVKTGEIREVKGPLTYPGQPSWSADGETIVMAGESDIQTNQILTVDVDTGNENYYPPAGEFKSISTRDDDGPVWSPDGRWMAFVVESTLRVMPVTEDGEPDGPPEQITDEATDSPSWSGDSEWLLYLNNGQLKKVKRDGSETHEIPTQGLDYHRTQPSGSTVIYAGRVWDGTSPELHKDATITVVNNRIEKIEPDSEPPDGDYVDASDLTVIPGLIDMHVHYTLDERLFGARQGRINLAFGVTSAVSMGDRAYRAIEDREALESGNRAGPRFFANGEAIDGSRQGFHVMRPTTSIEQIPLEMSRAIELDYDYMKTYIYLNAKRMGLVTDIAHEVVGVPTASHYLSTGALVGEDATTHLSANPRSAHFERNVSATQQSYADVIEFYDQGERATALQLPNAGSDYLLANEFEGDSRFQLFPPWREFQDEVIDNTEYPSDPDCNTEVCRKVVTAKKLFDRGVLIYACTDASLNTFGANMHSTLRPMVKYGFSPYEALVSATRYPAEHLGVEEDLGTLESGKLADMVFVEGNPLEQIEDAIQVRMTMKNGELFTIQDLVEPFEETTS